jgi:Xaa-Pro aminopeptidase
MTTERGRIAPRRAATYGAAMYEALFQSFDDRASGAAGAARVKALRTELARRNLTAFIVPRADAHQNEYVPASEERLAWLTGFSGSAGVAIVLMERAVLFDCHFRQCASDKQEVARAQRPC